MIESPGARAVAAARRRGAAARPGPLNGDPFPVYNLGTLMEPPNGESVLTIEAIRSRFASEWVLLADPSTGQSLDVTGGKVLCHSKDRDEVYRQALTLRPRHSAILYIGSLPAGVAVIL